MKKYLNFKFKLQNSKEGFTLIELLIVIVIIATLAVVVFVALNPAQRFQDARNARRTSDVNTILTAVHAYIVDNGGSLPSGLSTGMSQVQLGSASSGCAISTGGCSVTASSCTNLATPLVKYLKTIPVDPSLSSSSTSTGYGIVVDANNIVTVTACRAEGSTTISASR